MKYLEIESLTKLNAALEYLNLGDEIISGRVDCYSLKMVQKDKKLATHLKRDYSNEQIVKHHINQNKIVNSDQLGNKIKELTEFPIGNIFNASIRKLIGYFISTLNNTYPDFNFDQLDPSYFDKINNIKNIEKDINDKLLLITSNINNNNSNSTTTTNTNNNNSNTNGTNINNNNNRNNNNNVNSSIPNGTNHINNNNNHGTHSNEINLDNTGDTSSDSTNVYKTHFGISDTIMTNDVSDTSVNNNILTKDNDNNNNNNSNENSIIITYFWKCLSEIIDIYNEYECKYYIFNIYNNDELLQSLRPSNLWSKDYFILNENKKKLVYLSLYSNKNNNYNNYNNDNNIEQINTIQIINKNNILNAINTIDEMNSISSISSISSTTIQDEQKDEKIKIDNNNNHNINNNNDNDIEMNESPISKSNIIPSTQSTQMITTTSMWNVNNINVNNNNNNNNNNLTNTMNMINNNRINNNNDISLPPLERLSQVENERNGGLK